MSVKVRTEPFKSHHYGNVETYTHKITIPGTGYVAWIKGEDAAVKLAAKLAKTSTGKVGRRTIKAQPVITPLEDAK